MADLSEQLNKTETELVITWSLSFIWRIDILSIKELKQLLCCLKECADCGMCVNASPTKKEMREIIEELINLKEEKDNGDRED